MKRVAGPPRVVNAIRYVLRAVFLAYFWVWRRDGQGIALLPNAAVPGPPAQPQRGHHRQPVGEDHGKRGPRGYDAGKKVKGRKRHIVVDTQGLLLAVAVHPAKPGWWTQQADRKVSPDGGYEELTVGK